MPGSPREKARGRIAPGPRGEGCRWPHKVMNSILRVESVGVESIKRSISIPKIGKLF